MSWGPGLWSLILTGHCTGGQAGVLQEAWGRRTGWGAVPPLTGGYDLHR